jgi:hypothetical protein
VSGATPIRVVTTNERKLRRGLNTYQQTEKEKSNKNVFKLKKLKAKKPFVLIDRGLLMGVMPAKAGIQCGCKFKLASLPLRIFLLITFQTISLIEHWS